MCVGVSGTWQDSLGLLSLGYTDFDPMLAFSGGVWGECPICSALRCSPYVFV